MKKILEKLKSLGKTTKILILSVLTAVVLMVALLVIFSGSGKITISVETSLKEVIASSQLRTAKYTYNSIAEVKDGDNVKYYVSYNGEVSAGFDFENIEVVRDENKICIIVPPIDILEVVVDPDMDYIFVKKKYDTETVFAEASEVCKKDLLTKAGSNLTLVKTAEESAVDTLMALVKPFESQLEDGEYFEVVFERAEGVDAQ